MLPVYKIWHTLLSTRILLSKLLLSFLKRTYVSRNALNLNLLNYNMKILQVAFLLVCVNGRVVNQSCLCNLETIRTLVKLTALVLHTYWYIMLSHKK